MRHRCASDAYGDASRLHRCGTDAHPDYGGVAVVCVVYSSSSSHSHRLSYLIYYAYICMSYNTTTLLLYGRCLIPSLPFSAVPILPTCTFVCLFRERLFLRLVLITELRARTYSPSRISNDTFVFLRPYFANFLMFLSVRSKSPFPSSSALSSFHDIPAQRQSPPHPTRTQEKAKLGTPPRPTPQAPGIG